ncbi:MAG: hypothetical protein WCS21_07775 [Lachnospiraceae bacterium]
MKLDVKTCATTKTYGMTEEQLIREYAAQRMEMFEMQETESDIQAPDKSEFIESMYMDITGGETCELGINGTVVSFKFPAGVRFMGADRIKAIVAEEWYEVN